MTGPAAPILKETGELTAELAGGEQTLIPSDAEGALHVWKLPAVVLNIVTRFEDVQRSAVHC